MNLLVAATHRFSVKKLEAVAARLGHVVKTLQFPAREKHSVESFDDMSNNRVGLVSRMLFALQTFANNMVLHQ